MKVATDVMQVLSASEVDGSRLFIRSGQLERSLYTRLDKVLKAAGGKWNTKAKAHLFSGNAGEAIENIILTGEVTAPADFGYFPTPADVVDRLFELADIEAGMKALEPSAGRGAIAEGLVAAGLEVDCIELLEENTQHLAKAGCYSSVQAADFLSVEPVRLYDRLVMNPPFDKKRSDIHHVKHALEFLKPDGVLAAVMPSSVSFREDRLTRDFRGLVERRGGLIEPLPAGAFKVSGTMVSTVIVVIPG